MKCDKHYLLSSIVLENDDNYFSIIFFYCLCYIFQITNRDLLHAVVGLYNVSLSEMTPDVLYSTVCEKWARTIVLVRDLQGTYYDLL